MEMPLYGPGQGSMVGPLFWLLCYWLIVESVDPSIKLSSYVPACHSILLTLIGVSFLDDTGLGITSTISWDDSISPLENKQRIIQHTVQPSTGNASFSLQEVL
jgi:hypothetical protein